MFSGFLFTEGLGTTVDMLIRICDGQEDIIDLIDQAVKQGSIQGKRNDLDFHNNVQEVTPVGNTKQAGLRRLRSEIAKAELWRAALRRGVRAGDGRNGV